ncbi:lytic transglycosylase domain-containing protein [Phyllobacterium sp. YR531]|uniref:lytic transglycosylase domain-containing protein n=1 Tax=Phyllobacterium sp. YR531 TaxID=1144343 RepID=UPI00026F642F|nr:lytic transglycosylase domain-containing protein [Phyllobacterium sp. YR531]EJN02772.1 soluble lytic murein transglycosylase-like protein [Phyllobacterium sp. YR531]
MRASLTSLLAIVLFIDARAAHAQENGEPVKVTITGTTVPIDPQRFGPTSQATPCNGLVATEVAEGETIVRKIAKEEQFDSDLLVAIARQESGFQMNRISSAGAIGLMQLMPVTAKHFDVDPCNPEDNVRGAIRYLRVLQKRYQNPIYVLAAYNAGEGAVEKNGGVPLYPETVRYISAVLTDLYDWQPLSQGPAKARPTEPKAHNHEPENKPEAWSQGFVLHVE